MEARDGLLLLLLAAILSSSCGILHGRSLKAEREPAGRFVKRHTLSYPPLTADLRQRLAGGRAFSHPVRARHDGRADRSVDTESTCGEKSALLETDPVSPYSISVR